MLCALHSEIWCIFSLRNKLANPCFVNFLVRFYTDKMPKPGFYAVKVGRNPGVYTTWADCEAQVKGFPKAVYKKFVTKDLASNFIDDVAHKSMKNNAFEDTGISTSHSLEMEFNDSSDFSSILTSINDMIEMAPKITYNANQSKASFYAVHRGKNPGIYRTWTDCERQIKDIKNASYRKFDSEDEALEYVRTGGINKANKREISELKFDSNHVLKKPKLSHDGEDTYVLKNPEEEVVVFTDGASSENGKKRSRAGIGVFWGPNHPLNTSLRIAGRQTNNHAEIWAAIHALRQARQIGAKKVKLFTDSQFLIHAITDWINKWLENGWKLSTGEKVINKDDFIELNSSREGLEVDWIYVKAHARNFGNDEADRLAVDGAKKVLGPETCCNFPVKEVVGATAKDVAVAPSNPFVTVNANSSDQEVLPLILPNVASKKSFYAVHRGEKPGVYSTWVDCEKQIKNFVNPYFRKFNSKEEAEHFVKTGKMPAKDFKVPKMAADEFVTVFTDGASSSNGKEDARAGIGVYWGPGNPLNTSMRLPGRQTNNRAEIFAAVHALNQAKKLGIKNVRLYTDSQFVINGINTWIHAWKSRDWKLSNGKPVVNKDDFIILDKAREGINVDWCYIKAHDNNPGNVEADQLAVAGCRKNLSETMILTS